MDIFYKLMLICFLYAILSIVFNFATLIDILVISLAILVTAFTTIPIKFDYSK